MCIDYSKSWIFVVLTKRKRSVAHVTYLAIPLLVVNKTSKQNNTPLPLPPSSFLLYEYSPRPSATPSLCEYSLQGLCKANSSSLYSSDLKGKIVYLTTCRSGEYEIE